MTTAITLAGPEALETVLGLMERRQIESGHADWSDADRAFHTRATQPLCAGGPEGAVWLIGPARAPLGYAIVTFGWGLDIGGRVGWLDDLFIRPSVRRRGIGREVANAIAVSLRQAQVNVIRVRLPRGEASAQEFCHACGIALDTGHILLSDTA